INSIIKKNSTSILGYFSTINKEIVKELSSVVISAEEVLISVLQDFSSDTFYRLATRLLQDYEKVYINTLSNYISKEFKITMSNSYAEIEKVRSNSYVQLLVSFQKTFNSLNKKIAIRSFDDLNKLRGIISLNTTPLRSKDISSSELGDMLTEIPHNMSNIIEENGL